ncbi:MAG: hypothetical protein ACYS47_06220 [Planctomycetota bacterium]
MPEPTRYQESLRRPLMHTALGAILLVVGLALGLRGLAVVIALFGAFFFLGGSWGVLRIALGRSDHLVLTDDALTYVDPVHPDQGRNVPLANVAQVALDTGKVGRVKEMQITVTMRDGSKWTFGERFMDSRLLREFLEDAQERIRILPNLPSSEPASEAEKAPEDADAET